MGQGEGEGQGTGWGKGEGYDEAPTVIQQPRNVTVVVQQHTQLSEFDQNVFGCFGDIPVCLLGTFCAPCMFCYGAAKVGANLPVFCALYCCCPCVVGGYVRGEARKKYNIEGNGMSDCLLGCFCLSCTSCQIVHEVNMRED